MSQSNHVKKIAMVGANGHVGKYIAQELLKTGRFEITALTRDASSTTQSLPADPNIKATQVSYDDPSTLVSALQGQDVLIITLAVTAPRGTQDILVDAAAKAGVPFVVPNEWGLDVTHGTIGQDTMMGQAILATRKKIEELGKSSWIAMVTGFWYAFSLASSEAYGFDLKNRKVTFYDEGTAKINNITWERTGQAVAALLSLPIESSNPSQATLSGYKNGPVRVSSWLMTQKDMFKQVLRVSGTKESDWTIEYVPSAERFEEAKKRVFAGDRSAFQRMLYARALYNTGEADFESRYGLDDEKLGLEKETQESLDLDTKHAFHLAETGAKY